MTSPGLSKPLTVGSMVTSFTKSRPRNRRSVGKLRDILHPKRPPPPLPLVQLPETVPHRFFRLALHLKVQRGEDLQAAFVHRRLTELGDELLPHIFHEI